MTVALSKEVALFTTQLSHLKMCRDKGQVNTFGVYNSVGVGMVEGLLHPTAACFAI